MLFLIIACVIWVELLGSVHGSSLTFVIDDTLSMGDDIEQVRLGVDKIMDVVLNEKGSEIDDIVLVTFNDPDVRLRLKTNSRRRLKAVLNTVNPHNIWNRDCSEYALSGIELALRESKPGSYLYVFTDASAKDYKKFNIIKDLCQKTQSQVVFVLTGDCWNPESPKHLVYNEIAKASSGQVFQVHKDEVTLVVDTIPDLIKSNKTVLLWTEVYGQSNYVSVPFEIDDKTDYAIISASGKDIISVLVTTKNENTEALATVEYKMKTNKGQVLHLNNISAGSHKVWVKGNGLITIVVYAATNFLFEHGFSKLKPKTVADTSKQPTAGMQQHLSVSIFDPDNSVDVQKVYILDMNENEQASMTLYKISHNFYATDSFKAPTSMFKIKLTGVVKRTGEIVSRIARTPIEPQIPEVVIDEKAPSVSIVEGANVAVERNSPFMLTCKVEAYPEPNIVWTDNRGQSLLSVSSAVELPYKYISYLKLDNVVNPNQYTCQASNRLTTTSKTIDLKVLPVFKVGSVPQATTRVKYGNAVTIPCHIKSSSLMKISWDHIRHGSAVEIAPSDIYSISSDRTELTIKSVHMEQTGKYVCTASLLADNKETIQYSTVVKISDLVPPKANSVGPEVVTTLENQPSLIQCRISRGNPKSDISWYVKRGPSSKYQLIPQYGEKFHISNTKEIEAGEYKCVAENIVGRAEAVTRLVVHVAPRQAGPVESVTTVENQTSVLNCSITKSNPAPTFSWYFKSDSSSVYHSIAGTRDTLQITNTQESNAGTYKCVAENAAGRAKVESRLIVYVPPKVISDGPEVVTTFENQTSLIQCRISRGNPISDISWYLKRGSKYQLIPRYGEKFHISNTEEIEAGDYKCVAENIVGRAEAVTRLVVNARPRITTDRSEITAVTGDRVLRIPCPVTGYPKPEVMWTLKDKILKSGGNILIDEGFLIIHNPKENDTNIYTCVAKNEFGEEKKIFIATVTEDLNDENNYGERKNVYLLSHQSGDIKCQLPHNETDDIRWFKDGMELSENGPVLHLNNTSARDDGNYTCRISNGLGSWSETYVVDVGYPPSFYMDIGDTTIDWHGSPDVLLTCEVNSKPDSKVKWFRNGKIMRDITIIEPSITSMGGWGNYTCKVNNVHDEIERNFTVILDGCFINKIQENVENAPIILNPNEMQNWPEFESEDNFVIMKSDDEIKLSCHDKTSSTNAFINFPDKSEIVAVCDGYDTFMVDGKKFLFTDLKCKNKVLPVISEDNAECEGKGTETIEVGFKIDTNFLRTYEVCFDRNKNVPLYTRYRITSATVTDAVTDKWFTYPGFGDEKDERYTCKNSNSNCCYAKGRLAQDVAFGAAQTSTFLDSLNAIPVWRPCNNSISSSLHWEMIDQELKRKLYSPDISVRSGASMFDTKGVPKILWKVVSNEENEEIAIIYTNEPKPAVEEFCDTFKTSICNNFNISNMNCCKFSDVADKLKQLYV